MTLRRRIENFFGRKKPDNYTISPYAPLAQIVIENNWYNKNSQDQDCRRVIISSRMKTCNVCPRKTVYKINRYTLIFGNRLCWEHLPLSARLLLRQYYSDMIGRDAHEFIFGDKL